MQAPSFLDFASLYVPFKTKICLTRPYLATPLLKCLTNDRLMEIKTGSSFAGKWCQLIFVASRYLPVILQMKKITHGNYLPTSKACLQTLKFYSFKRTTKKIKLISGFKAQKYVTNCARGKLIDNWVKNHLKQRLFFFADCFFSLYTK